MRPRDATHALGTLLKAQHPEPFTAEFDRLRILAEHKYDEYQQFVPGRKFIDSLVQWLDRIPEKNRLAAYRFVLRRLVFFGRADMFHFTKMAYRHVVRPFTLRAEADRLGRRFYELTAISRSSYMKAVQQACLFLGLSDGARMDDFRRAANISNEQVLTTYQIADPKASEMLDKLAERLNGFKDRVEAEGLGTMPAPRFRYVCLIDDFTGSGTSFFVKKEKGWGGKLGRFMAQLDELERKKIQLVSDDWTLYILHYVATDRALGNIRQNLEVYNQDRIAAGKPPLRYEISAVQHLEGIEIGKRADDEEFNGLIEDYDVARTFDEHFAKGGPDGHQRWGFAQCALPVVLVHNTPNNSIAPLWVYADLKQGGLFPRIRRHLNET